MPTTTRPVNPIGPAVTLTSEEEAVLERIAPFEEIAEKVILGRTFKNMTQEQLADEIGSNPSYISLIESGKQMPGGAMLQKLSVALDITFEFPLKSSAAVAALAPKPRATRGAWTGQPAPMFAAEAHGRRR